MLPFHRSLGDRSPSGRSHAAAGSRKTPAAQHPVSPQRGPSPQPATRTPVLRPYRVQRKLMHFQAGGASPGMPAAARPAADGKSRRLSRGCRPTQATPLPLRTQRSSELCVMLGNQSEPRPRRACLSLKQQQAHTGNQFTGRRAHGGAADGLSHLDERAGFATGGKLERRRPTSKNRRRVLEAIQKFSCKIRGSRVCGLAFEFPHFRFGHLMILSPISHDDGGSQPTAQFL